MKRLTSMLLVLAMLLTFAPISVFAAEGEDLYVQTENMSAEEYAEWKQNLVASQAVTLASDLDTASNCGFIRNDFIEAYINSDGCYTMGTTGGNPDNENDNNKMLLFGHPDSDTTETLLKIDGEETFFYSQNTEFSADGKQAISTTNIDGVEVKQIITIETNTYTGNADVFSIKYVMTNKTSSSKQIGGRIMLDTMLGDNDGAPFRIPNVGNVVTEREFSGDQIPEYWQAFDNLSTPNVIATGNFYRNASEKPDKVQFAAWPGIVGSSWNYTVTNDRSVTGDSAVAAYFNPRTVAAGGSRTIVTYYGISDFSHSDVSGDISLRVTAPTFLSGNSDGYTNNPFDVTVYVGNNKDESISNVTAKIVLPDELEIEGSESHIKRAASISAYTESSVKWRLRAKPQSANKTVTYKIIVSGDGVEEKELSLNILLYSTESLYRTISFNLNGGDGTPPEAQRVVIGSKGVEPPKPTRSGYVFKGWYANPNCTGISWFSFLNIGALLRTTDNITLYAKWEENQDFVYGRDTFNFENTSGDFFSSTRRENNYKITGDYYDILLKNESNNSKQNLRDLMYDSWGGSCFGMSCVLSLVKAGRLDEAFFQDNATNLYDFEKPKANKTVFNLVNYYMVMQSSDKTSAARSSYNRTIESDNNRNLINTLNNSAYPVVLGFDIIENRNNRRSGGHAVVAYDVNETDTAFDVSIWDPNDKNNNVILRISKDYSTAEFLNSWYDSTSYHSFTKYALSVEECMDTYDYKNIQDELVSLGRSSGAEGIALMSLENEEKLEIIVNYDSFTLENSSGLNAKVENGEKTDGDLSVEYVDTINELGQELRVKFSLPVLSEGDYYIIRPETNQRSVVTDELLEEYVTSISDNSYNGFYNKVIMSDSGEIKIYKDGSIGTSSDTAVEQSILTSSNDNETSVVFSLTGKQISVAQSGQSVQLSGNSLSDGTLTVSDGYNETTLENIPTSSGSVSVKQNNEEYTLKNEVDGETSTFELGYSVIFYSLGGTLIDPITNIPKDTKVSKPEDPEREGFIFDGWYTSTTYDLDALWNFDTNTVDENTRLYAKWLTDENYMHSVTFKAEGSDDIIILVKDGEALTDIPEVPEKDGRAGQWDVSDFSIITSNMIVNAIYAEAAAKPVASPAGGRYSSGQSVTLTTQTQNGNIYYTTDGTTPTSQSTLYTQPIWISSSLTLKAVVVKNGIADSAVMTEVYTISSSQGQGGGGGGGGGGTSSYKISVVQSENGIISPSTVSVAKNGSQSFTITPNDGYEIEDVIVNGESIGNVADYTFEKVTKNATITAKFKKKTGTAEISTEPNMLLFRDVKEADWFFDSVEYVIKNNLMNGVSEDEFAPNDFLTRAMLVTVLYRNAGEPNVERVKPFDDVDMEAYYADAVIWAKENGIVNGVTESEFEPDAYVTREQFAAIMYRYAEYSGYETSVGENTNILSYSDSEEIADYAVAAMQYAVGSGLINGKSDTTLNPSDYATRAETAAILQRFIENNK